MQKLIISALLFALIGCAGLQANRDNPSGDATKASTNNNANIIDENNAIYEVQVADGVSYQDVVDSLKSVSEGMNFVNPANFPIGDHIKLRGIDPQGIKVVHSFCNLTMGTDIFLDHPEFLVFAPCRIAVYEKHDANQKLNLFIGLARPTYDLKSIQNPTERAQKAAKQLEEALILLLNKAAKGDI
jgi:uncharacterized protein (DUF302 family)